MANILFRVEGTEQTGYGHLVRCLLLAQYLRDQHDITCYFSSQRDTPGYQRAVEQEFDTYQFRHLNHPYVPFTRHPGASYEPGGAEEVMARYGSRFAAIIFDLPGGPPPAELRAVPAGILKVSLNDPDPDNLTDLLFYPIRHHVNRAMYDPFMGEKYAGPEWALLRPEFAQVKWRGWNEASPPHIFIAGGAADSKGIILKTLRALSLLDFQVSVDVMVSKLYKDRDKLNYPNLESPHFITVHTELQRPWEVLAHTTLAVLSFGVTAFETMAAGIPTLCMSISDDHESAADALSGGLVHLGPVEDVSEQRIAHAIRNVLRSDALARLSANARQMVDGKGVERVAAKIVECISKEQP